jgi:ankyrin repeat protein
MDPYLSTLLKWHHTVRIDNNPQYYIDNSLYNEFEEYTKTVKMGDIRKCMTVTNVDFFAEYTERGHLCYGNDERAIPSAPFICACYYKLSDFAFALIATGKSNPGAQNKIGYTALIYACEQKITDVALALIATGESNPGAQNIYGDTALIWACKYGLADVVSALIKTGKSNPGAQNIHGATALMHTIYNYDINHSINTVICELIATGESNPGAQNENG